MVSNLPRFGMFSGVLAFAGLPLYVHAPKYFVDTYGASLTTIGLILLVLRFVDFAQDPAIGWGLDKLKSGHSFVAMLAGAVMAVSMIGLFAVDAIGHPLVWFGICMLGLFSAYSTLSIMFYSQGLAKADVLGANGHVRVATWREGGALIGVCIASVLPAAFAALGFLNPMAGFAITFTILVGIASLLMRVEWAKSTRPKSNLSVILRDPILRKLLIIGVLNAAPVAVTASLFLFFVEYRLGNAIIAGPLLLVFFLSAAISVPFWAKLATRIGLRETLMIGMVLAIVTFAFTLTLGLGQIVAFGFVCAASGASLGADMTLLPASFARRIEHLKISGGQAFGLWGFCAKFNLALAAAIVLPAAEFGGFTTVSTNTDAALWNLTLLYAGLPCILKLIAIVLLARTNLEKGI